MEILKVFTIIDNQVFLGSKVGTLLNKANKKIPVICVGEKQWDNGFSCLSVILSNKQENLWRKNKEAHIFYARLMRCQRLASTDYYSNSCEQALIVFRNNIGQGGSNAYRGDLRENLKSHQPFPGRIIKKGKIGHIFLGKIYTGSQIIAIVSKKQVFSFLRQGQMQERNREEYYFFFDGHDIHVLSKAQRLNYSLFSESRP